MTVAAALFDIDGTLVDSNYLHVEAWSHALADLDLAVDDWRIHRAIGMDSGKLLHALVGDEAERLAEEAKRLHSRYYAELAPRLRAFSGARELVRTLAARGVTVVLATSAPESELAQLRATLEVEDAIAVVTSAADVGTAKPAPDIVEVAMEQAGVAPTEAILIGDTVWDVTAAARAGVGAIGVLSGGVAAAELLDVGAIAVYDDAANLLERLEDSALG